MVEYIRAWVIGAVAWFLLTNLGTLVFHLAAPAEHTRSFGWALVWLGAIGFSAYFLSAVAAALVHRAPDRHRFGRNAAAVLAAPAAGTVVDTARLLLGAEINWALYGGWTGIALVGAVLGFLLMRRLQSGRVTEAETGERIRVPKTYWDRAEETGEAGGGADGEGADGQQDPKDEQHEQQQEAAADTDRPQEPGTRSAFR
ncbi:hypothetical protein [Streptomonospora litoralis]|uniref:MFS transporter n=1 Tax=Streptomonospora litoralis TaxID=2498135 RepID=A0A4V0ZJE0_9ACTN|nr:hypothetical protein [Streptomonospora litoralis]QBI53152.1 hypothetical protein EKD16_06775 [Streptomonospora litoralis]